MFGYILSFAITSIVVLLSIGIFVTLPLLIGSAGNLLIRTMLRLLRIKITWKTLFFGKATLVLASFGFLATAVLVTNFAAGYAVLIAGSVFTLVAILLLAIQLFIRPSAHKNPAKAW